MKETIYNAGDKVRVLASNTALWTVLVSYWAPDESVEMVVIYRMMNDRVQMPLTEWRRTIDHMNTVRAALIEFARDTSVFKIDDKVLYNNKPAIIKGIDGAKAFIRVDGRHRTINLASLKYPTETR